MDISATRITVALNPCGRVLMTRDMELVRRIIVAVQSRKDISPQSLEVSGYDETTVARHLEMLIKADYVEGIVSRPTSVPHPLILVTDLSWAGHDLAAAIINEGVWQKIKQSYSAGELATMPLDIIKKVGVGLLAKWAESKAGL
jgi:hypothetical protein